METHFQSCCSGVEWEGLGTLQDLVFPEWRLLGKIHPLIEEAEGSSVSVAYSLIGVPV